MRKSFTLVAAVLIVGVLAGGSVRAQSKACDRACLEGFVEKYLDAAIAHDPKLLPLAQDVKFTENGQRLEIPDAHWKTMTGKGKYRLFVTDPEAGQVACIATIREEGGAFSPIALRLKVRKGQITEIEAFVTRSTTPAGPPSGAGRSGGAAAPPAFPSAADSYEKMGMPHPVYLEAIPPAERMSVRT